MICRAYNSFFRNFSSRSNIAIISLLRLAPMSVGAIAQGTGMEQSAVSHCLKNLQECSIVAVERKGKERLYSLNRKTVVPLLKLVEKHVSRNCKGCRHG